MFLLLLHKLSLVLLSLTSFSNAVSIPARHELVKRAVTWGDTAAHVASSAVCNDDQKRIIEHTMPEIVKLAKAGSDGLAIILDALQDDKEKRTVYRALDVKDQNRIRQTYFTFFGEPKEKKGQYISKRCLSFIVRAKICSARSSPPVFFGLKPS